MKLSSTNRAAVRRRREEHSGREKRSRPRVEEKRPVPEFYVHVKAKGSGMRYARARLIKQGRYVYLAWRGEKGPTRFYLGSVKDSSSTRRIRRRSSTSTAPAPGPDLASSKSRRKKRPRNAR